MRQLFLPGFPEGAERIGTSLSILLKDGVVTYFTGNDNYFSHQEGDKNSFRFAITSLIANRHVRAIDLEKSSLGLRHRTLMHWLAQYREHGASSFFTIKKTQRKPRVMTNEKEVECTSLLAAGHYPAYSTPNRPVIPRETGHRFHLIPASDSRGIRPPTLGSSDA